MQPLRGNYRQNPEATNNQKFKRMILSIPNTDWWNSNSTSYFTLFAIAPAFEQRLCTGNGSHPEAFHSIVPSIMLITHRNRPLLIRQRMSERMLRPLKHSRFRRAGPARKLPHSPTICERAAYSLGATDVAALFALFTARHSGDALSPLLTSNRRLILRLKVLFFNEKRNSLYSGLSAAISSRRRKDAG